MLTTRRRLLRLVAAVSAIAPMATLTAGSTPAPSPTAIDSTGRPIRRVILVPRFGGDANADWYATASRHLANYDITMEIVSLLPKPTAPGIDEMVAAIARTVGNNPREVGQTLLVGHSVGSRALLAYLSRLGAHQRFAGLVSVAGWFTVDNLNSYPVLAPWVHVNLDFASIASAAGPITVHLSDNDPYTADWRSNAKQWLDKFGATVRITHGAGHFMTANPGPIFDSIHAAPLQRG